MRVLDLGCGSGRDLVSWGVTAPDEVTGLDIDDSRLAIAKVRFSDRTYLRGAGECLPFEDESFDRVISALALPYMNIQKTLIEIHRVLVRGGGLSLSLHLPSFTTAELIHNAIPKPVPTLFRLYVMANGLLFHCTGRTVGFLKGRTESFQTERGMRVALNRAGFVNLSFSRATGPVGETFIVEARKSKVIGPFATARAASSQGCAGCALVRPEDMKSMVESQIPPPIKTGKPINACMWKSQSAGIDGSKAFLV